MRTYLVVLLTMITGISVAQNIPSALEGKWLGKLNVGMELRIVFNIDVDGDQLITTLDSPDQGVSNIPTESTTYTAATHELLINIPSIKGQYKGIYDTSSGKISGVWIQGAPMPLALEKVTEVKELVRPQEPIAPFPYRSEEVTFPNANAEGVTLSGTLTIPEGKGPFTAVILVTGSGPQDRNESLMGHKPFLVLSDYLTRKGIAVLRYDDRGVAASTGDHSAATSVDFASDANAAVTYLRSRKDLDINHIGIAGHSEGGLIAPLAASTNKQVDFVILLAGPGIPGDSILNLQADLIGRAMGMDEASLKMVGTYRQDLIDIAKQESDPEKMKAAIIAYNKHLIATASKEELEAYGLGSEDTMAAVDFYGTKWMHYFLTYDPRPVLEGLNIPVLAVNGTHDLQVPYKENLEAIEKALKEGGNKQYSTASFVGLNHLFQDSPTGSPSEYGQIEETFNREAMEAIATWILTLKLK